MIFTLLAETTTDVFGKISPPPGVANYDEAAGMSNFGLILFLSNLIKVATVVAGLIVFVNVVLAGLMYISGAGESGMPDKVKDKILHSVVGLALIVLSHLIIALISFFFFGDPGFILSPVISGPGA